MKIKYPNNKYSQVRYENTVKLVDELNNISETYKFELNDTSRDDYEIINLKGIYPITVNYSEYEKKYHFGLGYRLPYIDYDAYKAVIRKLELAEPNKIGVLHNSKIKAWVEYLIAIYEELIKESQIRVKKVNDFIARIEKANGTVSKDTRYGSSEISPTYSGRLESKDLEYSFQIHNNAYISQELRIAYSSGEDTLDRFLRMKA